MFISTKKSATIEGIWNIISFRCKQTKDEKACDGKAELVMINNKLTLQCERCNLIVPYYIVEKMVDKLVKEIVDDAKDGIESNMTNFRHKEYDKRLGVFYYFRVARHTPDSIKIEVWR